MKEDNNLWQISCGIKCLLNAMDCCDNKYWNCVILECFMHTMYSVFYSYKFAVVLVVLKAGVNNV